MPTQTVGFALGDEVAEEAVRTQVLDAFTAYEKALVDNDIEALTGHFWDSERVVRYGVADLQRGAESLRRWRLAQPELPRGRQLSDTDVLVLGPAAAVVTTLFTYPGRSMLGRQTQVWARKDGRWCIVSAHVSEVADPPG